MIIIEGISGYYLLTNEYLASLLLTLSYSVWGTILLTMALGVHFFGHRIVKIVAVSVAFHEKKTSIDGSMLRRLKKSHAAVSESRLYFWNSFGF